MIDENLVWYASYGSNLLRSRFLCYIQGGQPEGANRSYLGCSNNKSPEADKPILIPHQLYFSKSSTIWENKGVAFIDQNPDHTKNTFGRIYLITKQQFKEVVLQENTRSVGQVNDEIIINFDEIISIGKGEINANWYDCILYLGTDLDHPIFTFTNSCTMDKMVLNPPGERYLKVIIKGIKETHSKSDNKIVEYLQAQPGIKGEIPREKVEDIVRNCSC
jgi:hypothetical protein